MAPPPTATGRRSFRFRHKIGSGAFGEVYLAEMISSGGFAKVVAVKVLKPEFLDEADIVGRMRDEGRLLGHLRHPAIVQADDLIMLGGRVAIVMEYVPGANLLWLIHPRQNPDPLPPAVLSAIICRVAEALEAAWSRPSTLTGLPLRVLHRDIKPSNIRITPDGEVKVLDFGVARSDALERETSTHNQLIGSLTFLAPEVFLSHPVLPATDIYALGVTFYESIARTRFGRCGLSPDYHQDLLQERLRALDLSNWGACAEPVRGLLGEMLAFEPVQRPTAGGVATFCARSCRALAGPDLRDWARENVERVAGGVKLDPKGALVGATLDEDSSQRSVLGGVSAPTIPPDGITELGSGSGDRADRRRSRGLLLAMVMLLFLLVPALVAVGVGVAWYMDTRVPPAVRSRPVPEPVVAPLDPATLPAEPVVQALPVAEAPVVEPEPRVDPEPRVAPQPRVETQPRAEPQPRVEPQPRSQAEVRVTPAPEVAARPPAPAPVEDEAPAVALVIQEAVELSQQDRLSVEVSAPRRSLRNSTLHATVNTGLAGCDVTVHWKTEGLTAWEQASLGGPGPVFSWSLDVTGQHRPAILFYVNVTGCGEGGAGSASEPLSIAVL